MNRRGVTLIELMVAVGLGTMLIGLAAMIFMQSQDMFTETNSRVINATHTRVAARLLNRDLAHASQTHELEFYRDANGDGAYTPGEELPGQDPLPGPGGSANAPGYSYGLGLCSATYTRTTTHPGEHRADAVYVRVEPGQAAQPYLAEYRLQEIGESKMRYIRRVIERDPSGASVVSWTETLVNDVISLTFEVQGPSGAWIDAGNAAALGFRVPGSPSGALVECCFEGTGRFAAGERSLRIPFRPGLGALRPGASMRIGGATPPDHPVVGLRTIADLSVQGSEAVVRFEERLPSSPAALNVSWRAAWIPSALRARLTIPGLGPDASMSSEIVVSVR